MARRKTLGTALRNQREKKTLSREQVARKLKITPGYLGHLETDNYVHVSERLKIAFHKMFGIPKKQIDELAEKANKRVARKRRERQSA